MKKQDGVTLPVLIILIAIIIIVTSILINYVKNRDEEIKGRDLKTNMLLIQAQMKKDLEAFYLQTANLDKNKEEDKAKIEQVKQETLKGTLVQGSKIENSIPTEITINENCYYLDEDILNEIGIKNGDSENYGYFVVKYDFESKKIEVINTIGYEGKYTLTELSEE